VQPGETLAAIAERHYRDPAAAIDLLEANRPMLGAAGDLVPGLVLRVPQR